MLGLQRRGACTRITNNQEETGFSRKYLVTHSCFVCSAEAPNRIIFGDRAQFAEHYVGPVGRAHGGISIGTLNIGV